MTEGILRSLDMAALSLQQVRKSTRKMMAWPILLIPVGLAIMTVSEYLGMGKIKWYMDPFLCSIMAVFIWAQIVMFRQMRKVTRGEIKAGNVLTELSTIPRGTKLTTMRQKIMSSAAACHLRDILVRWIDLGTQAETKQFGIMMENSAKRRASSVNKQMATHISINRILLKLGFLGTLIGLSMAFTPMKDAILALDIAGEEGSYVRKIANAIDADAYAILATLVATAFSVFVEGIIIQNMRKIFMSFEDVNNFVDEWCMTEFIPWINELKVGNDDMDKDLAMQKKFQQEVLELKKKFLDDLLVFQQEAQSKVGAFQQQTISQFAATQKDISGKLAEFQTQSSQLIHASQDQILKLQQESAAMASAMQRATLESFAGTQSELNGKVLAFQKDTAEKIGGNQSRMLEMQNAIRQNVEALVHSVSQTGELTETMVPMQKAFGARVRELAEYERQYRSFLAAQNHVKVPSHLKPEPQV